MGQIGSKCNPGLFQIRFQYRIYPFGANLAHFGANSDSPVFSWHVYQYCEIVINVVKLDIFLFDSSLNKIYGWTEGNVESVFQHVWIIIAIVYSWRVEIFCLCCTNLSPCLVCLTTIWTILYVWVKIVVINGNLCNHNSCQSTSKTFSMLLLMNSLINKLIFITN